MTLAAQFNSHTPLAIRIILFVFEMDYDIMFFPDLFFNIEKDCSESYRYSFLYLY